MSERQPGQKRKRIPLRVANEFGVRVSGVKVPRLRYAEKKMPQSESTLKDTKVKKRIAEQSKKIAIDVAAAFRSASSSRNIAADHKGAREK